MNAWIPCALAAALLAAAGLAPVKAEAAYDGGGFFLALRLGGLPIPLRKRNGPPPGPGEEKSPKTLPRWPIMRILVKNGYTTLCRIVAHARVETLTVRFTAAWTEPSAAAMLYAAAGIAMESLSAMCHGRVKEVELRADVDFDAGWPALLFHIRVSQRLFRLLAAALVFGFGFLRDYLAQKKGKDK